METQCIIFRNLVEYRKEKLYGEKSFFQEKNDCSVFLICVCVCKNYFSNCTHHITGCGAVMFVECCYLPDTEQHVLG